MPAKAGTQVQRSGHCPESESGWNNPGAANLVRLDIRPARAHH